MVRVTGLTLFTDQTLKIGDGFLQALCQRYARRPAQILLGQGDIRLALPGIILGQRFVHNLSFRAGQIDNFLGKFENREFRRIAQINGTGDLFFGIHKANQALDQIVHVAEGACLASVTEDGSRMGSPESFP